MHDHRKHKVARVEKDEGGLSTCDEYDPRARQDGPECFRFLQCNIVLDLFSLFFGGGISSGWGREMSTTYDEIDGEAGSGEYQFEPRYCSVEDCKLESILSIKMLFHYSNQVPGAKKFRGKLSQGQFLNTCAVLARRLCLSQNPLSHG